MNHRIGLAVACLHISAGLYVVLGVVMFVLLRSADDGSGIGLVSAALLGGLSLALAAGVEVVAAGLRQRKFWAWVAGLCVFAVYVPSLFFPLGALGLWGLLDERSRALFVADTGRRAR